MVTGWRYRVVSAAGVLILTAAAVLFGNLLIVQQTSLVIPIYGRLTAISLAGDSLVLALVTTLTVMFVTLFPLFKPQPRRILDVITLTQQRVVLGMVTLAAIGYFDYTYRLPRTTLVLTTAVLLVALPVWFVAIRRRKTTETTRALIVGDDPQAMEAILGSSELPIIGYVSPPSRFGSLTEPRIADGSGTLLATTELDELACLGGLSQLEEVFVEHDIDTAILAFAQPDRAEFFGVLDSCYDHGVTAKVHRDYADVVLTTEVYSGDLVGVDLEPWDWQDHILKRLFDIAFAGMGLLVASPLLAIIAIAIKLDSDGPVLYSQERTATFGETFRVYKFRSMITEAEAETGATLSDEDAGGVDPRVTRVGRVLRQTHLDEIPQLWSILSGHMSVVGPRPERPELDADIETEVGSWRRRWFVKPGLTGLAQINDVTGYDPEEKLRYDVAYIRRQSLLYDIHIVIRQVWKVGGDVVELLWS